MLIPEVALSHRPKRNAAGRPSLGLVDGPPRRFLYDYQTGFKSNENGSGEDGMYSFLFRICLSAESVLVCWWTATETSPCVVGLHWWLKLFNSSVRVLLTLTKTLYDSPPPLCKT